MSNYISFHLPDYIAGAVHNGVNRTLKQLFPDHEYTVPYEACKESVANYDDAKKATQVIAEHFKTGKKSLIDRMVEVYDDCNKISLCIQRKMVENVIFQSKCSDFDHSEKEQEFDFVVITYPSKVH